MLFVHWVTVSAFSLVIPVQLNTSIIIVILFLYFVEQINVIMMMMMISPEEQLWSISSLVNNFIIHYKHKTKMKPSFDDL